MLKLFCSTGRQKAIKSFLWASLPNGDWRNKTVIEVWVAPGLEYNEATLTDQVVHGVLMALSRKIFTTYNQSKWLGCDLAIDEVGLLEAVHGLASSTFAHMMEARRNLPRSSGADAAVLPPSQGGPAQNADAEAADVSAYVEPEIAVEELPTSAGQPAPVTGAPPVLDPATLSSQAWSAVFTQRQRTASQWLSSNPLGRLMMVRLALQPMSKLLQTYIERSGDLWEQTQRAHEATVLAADSCDRTPRRTALLELVALTAERCFYEELKQLREPGPWRLVPQRQVPPKAPQVVAG